MPTEVIGSIIIAVSNVVSSVIVGVVAVYFAHRLQSKGPSSDSSQRRGHGVVDVHPREGVIPPNQPRQLTWWWTTPAASIAVFALVGFLLGTVTRALRDITQYGNVHVGDLVSIILLAVLVAGRAVRHRQVGYHVVFQLENMFLWITYITGWSVLEGRIWDDLLVVAISWWFGCSLVGGWIASRKTSRSSRPRKNPWN